MVVHTCSPSTWDAKSGPGCREESLKRAEATKQDYFKQKTKIPKPKQ